MKKAIVFKNVSKNYKQLKAVDGISLTIEKGEFFGLLGPNGAGKSTLINMMAGLVKPSNGSIDVMGFNVNKEYQEARHSVGIVPQELVFDPFFNVREMLRFQAGYFGKDKLNDKWVDEVIERLDLTDKASTNMRKLSGGMKRRALIAQALVHRPPVIVLDEPTAGVDVELRQKLWSFIKELNNEGHTIVLTTHYLEEAEALCNRVAMMKEWKNCCIRFNKKFAKGVFSKKFKSKIAKK
jgi:ABC-2 type transport system ATP-binding protein